MWARCAFVWVIGALVTAAFVGCGSDDEKQQNSSQSTAAACAALCDKQVAAQCGLTRDMCSQLCTIAGQSAQCEARAKAYIDCQQALANVCDGMTCEDQFLDVALCIVPDAGSGG